MSYVARNLLQRKVRSSLCILGVAVSVAMIVALISLTTGMRQSFNNYMETSGASLVVFSRDAADLAFSRVRREEIEGIEAIPGVESVSRGNFTAVMDKRSVVGGIPIFGRIPGERIMDKYERALVKGRLLRERNELMVGTFAAQQMKIGMGDKISPFGRPMLGIEEFEIVGVYQSPINWENLGLIAHGEVVQEHLRSGDTYPLLFVYTDPERADETKEAIEAAYGNLIAMKSGEFIDRFAAQMEFMDDFILIVTIIALVVGVLGVVNTMMMSVSERRREIGTLRAVGWSRTRVLGVIVSEGLLIATAGGVLGLVLGVAGTEALLAWFPSGVLVATYLPGTFLKGILVAVIVGLIGAFYPGWRACRVSPVEAMRYE